MNQNVSPGWQESPGVFVTQCRRQRAKDHPGALQKNRCNLSTHLYILLVNVRCFENCRSVLSIKMIFFFKLNN